MALADDILKLDRALTDLSAAYDVTKAELRLDELLRAITTQQAKGAVFEEHGKLAQQVAEYHDITSDTAFAKDYLHSLANPDATELADAQAHAQRSLERVAEFILQQKFTGKYDKNGAIVSLQVLGNYGFSNEHMRTLAQAYERFATGKAFSSDRIYESDNEIDLQILGEYAFAQFRGEHGVHRVEYVQDKVTGTGSKPQTARITVKVEPFLNGKAAPLNEDDIAFEHLGSHGTGGGGSDTSNYGIRATHKPTGITAVSRRRSQNSNYKIALDVLASRVAAQYAAQQDKALKIFANPADAGIVRSYNLIGDKFIKDHRTKCETRDLRGFFEGNLESFIRAYHGVNFTV